MPPIVSGILTNETYSTDSLALNAEGGRQRLIGMNTVRDEVVHAPDGVGLQINDEPDMVKREENSSSESDLAGQERKAIKHTRSRSPAGSTPLELRDISSSYDDSIPSESPTGRLGGILESLTLSSRSRRPSTTSNSSALSDPARWMPLLRPSETPVFTSSVLKATRRAFPRQLLPLTGGAKKGLITQGTKARLLVLTKTRLLCVKERDGELVVKNEMLIGGQGGGIGVVTGVEKGDQTFVVQTVSSFLVKYSYHGSFHLP